MRQVDVLHCAVVPLLLLVSPNTATTAFVISLSSSCRRLCQQQQQSHSSTLIKPQYMIFQRFINQFSKHKHYPSEEDDNTSASYNDLLREASKSPEAFERFVENSMMISSSSSNINFEEKKSSSNDNIAPSSEANANKHAIDDNGNEEEEDNNTPTKYIPIEEWERNNGENMTAEERLQWECQRNGDQFRQNDILTQNLKQF